MYFPRLYPDELLYSGIARCRVHLGIGSHKTLLHMLFGDSKVAAITDLPTHLTALANNTGLDAEGRQDGAGACYAWLYRHDRHWLMVAN